MDAVGANGDGYREAIGCAKGFTEPAKRWRDFLSWQKSRGLRGVRMFTGDKAVDMVSSIAEVFPKAKYLRCTVHFLNGKGEIFLPIAPPLQLPPRSWRNHQSPPKATGTSTR